ncbi:PQQ-dependent sugar dehydrogenase [Verrucomicrobiales bacterium BCK34]|nr:PQQ-dependent sugar dehydrogenase [Verrucomicrobiales bacterium BCK34]
MHKLPAPLFLAAAFAVTALQVVADEPRISLTPIYSHLEFERPLSLQIPDDGTNRRFLVEQTGKIKLLSADEKAGEASVFFDVTDRMGVEKDFEEGLLGMVFHPDFKNNGRFFLTYSKQGPKRLVLSEFQVSGDDPNKADPASERVLIEVQQPEWNHNSGNILFDPKDGLLYLTVGDGGMKNGVYMLSQKLTRWNGKVLRIDVDGRTGDLPYGIPEDNPFINDPIACPEIWALGLRNPWGSAIDPETGLFFLADVGQDLYEEINIIKKAGNYGWEYREGNAAFPLRAAMMAPLGKKPDVPADLVLEEPIHQYDRADGLSITGGFVYRGKAIPALAGHFLYGDWRFGNLWALHYDADSKKMDANHHIEKPADLSAPTVQPTGFYPDENGEAIVLGWKGNIFRITPAQ